MRRALAACGAVLLVFLATGVPAAADTPSLGPFTATETLTRTHLNPDGTETTVDGPRTFHVNVNQTLGVRGRQLIGVSWTGAHPTGGIVTDPNSSGASRQEYPVVVMECRGIDSAGAPAGQRLTPESCWTQSPPERFQDSPGFAFPEWRLDRYAAPADRRAIVDAPTPNDCGTGSVASRYVPFVSTTGEAFFGGSNGLCGMPPEAAIVQDPSAPPADTTYAASDKNGSGATSFVVWTGQQNASLGCSDTIPCALVVIPIMGISCDPAGSALPAADRAGPDDIDQATALCEKTGRYAPGEAFSSSVDKGPGDTAVVGALWWSESNWRNRVVVPLNFAPAPNACDVLDSRVPVDIYGSELMNQAALQWSALFCHDPRLFKFRHVRTGEPQATAALASGSINAAFISRPPDGGYAAPTVNAPVAVSGFAVSYVIDDANKHPYTTLRLNARLIAKLLSESYWSRQALHDDFAKLKSSDPYRVMANNPQDVTVDPEFIALNPGVGTSTQTQASAELLALSGNSDVMYALTSYLAADPDARAFLDGAPDPWGMRVNPSYKGIPLPQPTWPLLDTFKSPDIDLDGCLRDDHGALVPATILPLIAAPTASLTTIAQSVQYGIANPTTFCQVITDPGSQAVGHTLKPLGREQPGARFLIGITSLGDTGLFGLRNAALQSSPGHYAAPTDAALRAAIRLATVDRATRTWPIPYAKLRTSAAAYPGTMVVYAAIPVTGLDAAIAVQLGQFLQYAAGAGQSPGEDVGRLPPGYLPMTAANGVGALAAYTRLAATAVAQQASFVPVIGGPASPGGSTPSGGGGGGGGGSPTTTPTPGGTAGPTATGPASDLPPPFTPSVDVPTAFTDAAHSTTSGILLPVAVLASVAFTVLAAIIRAVSMSRATSNVERRLAQISLESRSRS